MTDDQGFAGATGVLPTLESATPIAWDSFISKSHGVYGFDSIDSRSRSFNLMRSRLLQLRVEHSWRMVGVVSATPNVGKSFISANLAAALSRVPRYQSYVVDMDLRRGSLTNQFGITAVGGVREFLEGAEGLDGPAGYVPEGERLIIVPTTSGHVHSAELLATDRAQSLLRAARVSDDRNYFIFDLPPVFANDDAAMITARLDGYVVVAEEGKTTQKEIADTVSTLGSDRLAGVILNKYRGGVLSEGYGIGDYYATGYADFSE